MGGDFSGTCRTLFFSQHVSALAQNFLDAHHKGGLELYSSFSKPSHRWFHAFPDTYLLCFSFVPRSAEKAICHSPCRRLVFSCSYCNSFIISRPSLISILNCLGLLAEPILSRRASVRLSQLPSTPCFWPRFTVTNHPCSSFALSYSFGNKFSHNPTHNPTRALPAPTAILIFLSLIWELTFVFWYLASQ